MRWSARTISVPTRDETAVITAVNSTSEIEIDAAFSAVVNGTLSRVYGYYQFRMPDNFSSLIAGPYFTTTQRPCDDIEVTSEGRIRSYRQHGQTTGRPATPPCVWVHDSGNQPTHYEMILHPPPDKIYSLSIQHAIAQDKPDYVNASSKYPPGRRSTPKPSRRCAWRWSRNSISPATRPAASSGGTN
jgi:hypothetical protein